MSTKRTSMSAVSGVVPSGSAHWERQFMFVSWFVSVQINKKRNWVQICVQQVQHRVRKSVWHVSQLGSVREVWRVSLFGCVSDVFVCCTRLTCLRSGTCVLICVSLLGRLFFRGGQAVPQQTCCAGTEGILCGTDFAYVYNNQCNWFLLFAF
jgi:uncharacterized protein (DUF486 family)